MLTESQCPWTGPYGLPSSGLRSKGPTPKALKRAMGRLELLPWPDDDSAGYDEQFNQPLAHALDRWDPGHTGYGRGRWEKLRATKVPAGHPHAGEYALDGIALELIKQDHREQHPPPPPYPTLVYPHDKDWHSFSGGFVHQTGGIPGNQALDFLAVGGTPVLAVEAGVVSRTSGYDPATGLHGSAKDVFGWSVYIKCKGGFWYYTHFGQLFVNAGSVVRPGDVIGFVGHWPGDPGRSHTHLGYTHFSHINYLSRAKIRACAAAPRVDGRSLVRV